MDQFNYPHIIDMNGLDNLEANELTTYNSCLHAWNRAPEFTALILPFINHFKIKTAIETGAFFGQTTYPLTHMFQTVYTLESNEGFCENLKKTFADFPNGDRIHIINGSSDTELSKLLPTLKEEPLFFYLDAHWEEHWPLLSELDAISETHKDNCIILVDDVDIPSHGI